MPKAIDNDVRILVDFVTFTALKGEVPIPVRQAAERIAEQRPTQAVAAPYTSSVHKPATYGATGWACPSQKDVSDALDFVSKLTLTHAAQVEVAQALAEWMAKREARADYPRIDPLDASRLCDEEANSYGRPGPSGSGRASDDVETVQAIARAALRDGTRG